MRAIIFDFNRTLFDPDSRALVSGTLQVLKACRKRGFLLVLVSRRERGRQKSIASLSIKDYFRRIIITPKKSVKTFQRILRQLKADPSESYIVGDRVREEIVMGNTLGLRTIWVRQNIFAREAPRNKKERPMFAVLNLRDVMRVVK
ncbi:MAG: HAD hydrolase-like protein [Candidatus Sungbacteria bacterium]|nr:HAD hydrolase-like protein [Candidatus Sungbacteria bacterium]